MLVFVSTQIRIFKSSDVPGVTLNVFADPSVDLLLDEITLFSEE